MNLPLPTGPDPLRKLSEELHALAEEFRERKVTLQEVMVTLGGRASGLMIVILALPFCSPISIPGLSVPFGAVIFVLGACFVAGRPPWLPQRLLAVELPRLLPLRAAPLPRRAGGVCRVCRRSRRVRTERRSERRSERPSHPFCGATRGGRRGRRVRRARAERPSHPR